MRRIAAGRIVLIYAAFAGLWITVSDRLLSAAFTDLSTVTLLATLKGLLFVAATSVLIYSLIKLNEQRLRQEEVRRGRTEQALHESDAQMRWMGDMLPGSYLFQYTNSPEGRPCLLHVGGGVKEIHQLEPAEVMRDPRALFYQVDAKDRAVLLGVEESTRRTMTGTDFFLRCTRPDGETRWLHVRCGPRRDESGRVIWDGIAIDMTQQRAATETVQLAKAKLDAALASMSDAVSIADVHGRLIEINDSFVAFHRFRSRSDCARMHAEYPTFLEVCDQDGRSLPVEEWAVPRALRGEVANGAEFQLRRKDTGETWIGSYNFSPIRDAAGQITGAVVTARDVTAARLARNALRESEEQLRSLVTMLPEAMFVNQDGAITFVNRAGLNLFRARDPAEILGRSPLVFFHPDDHPMIRARIREMSATGQVAPLWECRLLAVDGTIVPVETTAVALERNGMSKIQVVVRDITERKKAEIALRAHEANLEETGRIARVGGWGFEVATGAGYWTAEVARIHDLDPKTPISAEAGLKFYAPQSRPLIEAAVRKAIEHQVPYDLELELVSARGVHKWIRTIGHPVVEHGRVVRLHGSFQDISERRQVDEERDRQRRRLALLADISGRLVLSETSGGILQGIFSDLARELEIDIFANYMVSPAGDRLILESSGGLPPEQHAAFAELAFDVSLCGLVARDRQPRIYADLPKVTEPQAAGIIGLGVKAYAGFPLMAGGRIIGTVSFGSRSRSAFLDEDLRLMKAVADQVAAAVERRRLFDALKDGEERFREVVENIQEVFWLSDVAKEKALYVSPGFATIWGRSCESVVQSMAVWTDSIHPEDRARVIEAARTRQMLGTYHETYRILRPDGTLRWVRDRAFPIKDADGRVTRIVGVAEDITQQREMESRFLRSQRLEAVGTLAGGIAHDLNNILAPVLMISGLLKDSHPQPAEQKMFDMLESSAKRGAGIIRQLLAFSRGATGEMGVVQLRHLAHEMCTLMKETFPRDIAIVDSFPPDLWLVLGDGTQLHQVFMNLCVNARDAMPEGGKLTVRGANVDLSAEDAARHPGARAGHYVCITFEDTGSGIPPEIMDRIFDPFFTTKEMGKGTGLGLSTVLGIVKSHQGFITLTSVIGKGASFQVYLPASDGCPASAAATAAAPSARGQGELIIVVDDEDTVRASTKLILERSNYRVAVAGDGREAVARFLENQDAVRLVLTDLMMPVMGGVALARSLHNLRPDLPIIATTGLEEQSKQAELRQLGVRDILVKPYTAPELLTLVRQRLDRG